jgi:hypothetical protein
MVVMKPLTTLKGGADKIDKVSVKRTRIFGVGTSLPQNKDELSGGVNDGSISTINTKI